MEKAIRYFIENRAVTGFILILILLIGIFSFLNLNQDIFPSTDMNTMIIDINYPGASPRDSEINAIIPIEEQLSMIPGITDTVSLSVENGGTITVYLDQDLSDVKSVKDQIYREIGTATEGVTPEVEKINIIDVNPKMMSVYSFGITAEEGSGITEKALIDYALLLEEKIKRVQGVGEVKTGGVAEREIKINVNPYSLKEKYVSLNEIIKSIENRNIRATGGTLQSVQKEQSIVTIGQFDDPAEVGQVIIRSTFERPALRIDDIANVEDSFKKQAVLVRVNKKPGITFSIVKKEDAGVVTTVDNIKQFLEKEKKSLPEGIILNNIDDRSLSIRSLLSVVASNAVMGFVLVFIILLIFLDFRTAFWTAFGIPTTLLMLFVFFGIMDYSLDLITLGAVITVLGMLVDHGIVIAESIYSYRKKGYEPVEATLAGVKEVLSPVVITILTTIAAFLPLLYISGTMGKFINVYPVIISAALILSFLEAVFILPGHLTHVKKKKVKEIIADAEPAAEPDRKTDNEPDTERKTGFDRFSEMYRKLLLVLLNFRYLILLFFIFTLGLTLYLSRDNIKNFVLMWDNTADAFFVNLETPAGTSLEATSEKTALIEEVVSKVIKKDELYSTKTNIGHHNVKKINSQGNHTNWSQITVYLVPQAERSRTVEDIMKAVNKEIKQQQIKGFEKILFAKQSIGPSASGLVEIKIAGSSAETRKKVSDEIETFMNSYPGVLDLETDQKPGKEELKVDFNYSELAKLELDVASVAKAVKTAYDGTVATSFQTENEKIDFRVQIDENYRRDVKFLQGLLIPNAKGRLIRLDQIAAISSGSSPSIINHYNGDRVITITSRVDRNLTTANMVTSAVKSEFNSISEKYSGIRLIIKGEAEETSKSIADLGFSFVIAIILIYFLLVLLFGKIEQPLIVILTIPFGIIGALLAFVFHNMPLSFMGLIGMIGLSGVVVNDSVIMVSFINKLMKESAAGTAKLKEWIAEGAKQRLRPIILTTVTTVAGLLPSVYGIGGDVKSLVPVVMAISYGLIFATIVSLFLIPSLFLIVRDIKNIFTGGIKA
ncbi:MAG: efflux RND transporter permease subunit [Spirochaetia bacterium]|nr:efflux RND transporter permease subunit [Spirochaetia bacterium]